MTIYDIVFEWDRIATRIFPWNPTRAFPEEVVCSCGTALRRTGTISAGFAVLI